MVGLNFRDGDLRGFDASDLAEELDHGQIRAILSLFGAGDYADGFTPAAKPLRGSDPPTAVDRDYTAFHIAMRKYLGPGIEGQASHAQRLYRRYMASHRPAGLNAHDLSLLYSAALSVASLAPDGAHYRRDAREALDALARHDQATPERVTRLHNALVAARRFTAANQLATDYPDASLKKLLTFRDMTTDTTTQPSVLLIEPAAGDMLRKPINLDQGQHIVIIAGCHFSVDAVTSIEAHPDIARVLARHGLWLANQNESLADVAVWNKDHPNQPMNVAWTKSEWQRITSWAMPTFYIFKHGKLVDQWAGWPADTGLTTLRQHLQENGYLDSTQ